MEEARKKPDLIVHEDEAKPQEAQLQNDLFRIVCTTAFMGYWIGTGVGFIKAGTSIEAFYEGVIKRDAAIGTVTAASLGLAATFATWGFMLYRNRRRKKYEELEISRSLKHERHKIFYRPSTSPFYRWDVRLFLASQAAAALGAVIFMKTASDEQKSIGDFPGRAFGSIGGAALGLIFPELIGQWVAKTRFFWFGDPIRKIKERFWFTESRHDVPLYVRVFFGAWSAFMATSVFDESATNDDFDLDKYNEWRFWWVVGSSIVAGVLHALFAGLRANFSICGTKLLSWIHALPKTDQRLLSLSWLNQSRMDLPSYVRIFCGVAAAVALGSVMATYNQTPFDKNALYIYSAVTFASPFILAFMRAMLSLITKRFSSTPTGSRIPTCEQPSEPTPLKMSFDMPWYARVMFASIAGMMIGQSIEYAKTVVNDSYYDNPPSPTNYPVIGAWLTVALSVVTPMLMAGLGKIGFSHSILNPVAKDKEDTTWPWYARLLAGVWMGALLGTAIGNLCAGKSCDFGKYDDEGIPLIVDKNIGPEFLAISNAVGATTGVFVGGSIALVWPLAQLAWDLAGRCCLYGLSSLFPHQSGRHIQHEDDHPDATYGDVDWFALTETPG